MPYEAGMLSVKLGELQVRHLNRGILTTGSTFQLQLPVRAVSGVPPKQGSARRIFSLKQSQSLVAIIQERDESEIAFDPDNPGQAPDKIGGPELVFHGSTAPWDLIYESGGLMSQGTETSVHLHVESSSESKSAYVSGTRSLSVACSFANSMLDPQRHQYGFVYLFHVEGGIVVSTVHGHAQAEIAGIGEVPIRDILMFKWLGHPRRVYVNLEYAATSLAKNLITQGLYMIGGGALP